MSADDVVEGAVAFEAERHRTIDLPLLLDLPGDLATVRYTPAAGYTGGDTFNYTLRDARGATATGKVTITVAAQSAWPFEYWAAAQSQELDDREVGGPAGILHSASTNNQFQQ